MFPKIAGINYESVADGVGVRTAIYLSGCSHHCDGCQNPQTWDEEYGTPCSFSTVCSIADQIIARQDVLSGITLTGGDPFYDPDKTYSFLACLMSAVQRMNSVFAGDIWIYTGFTFEELKEKSRTNPDIMSILMHTKVLVDGRYDQKRRDVTLPFRGSANQRIINVPLSLAFNNVVLFGEERKTYE